MANKAKKVINLLKRKKVNISIVESCTGGLLASKLTSIKGASKVFKLGLITYSNNSKITILKISKLLIKKYGAVSRECCSEMLVKLSKLSHTNISISITGIAGPNGGSKKKPVGLVYIGIKKNKKITVHKFIFSNKGRIFIQKKAADKALYLIDLLFK